MARRIINLLVILSLVWGPVTLVQAGTDMNHANGSMDMAGMNHHADMAMSDTAADGGCRCKHGPGSLCPDCGIDCASGCSTCGHGTAAFPKLPFTFDFSVTGVRPASPYRVAGMVIPVELRPPR